MARENGRNIELVLGAYTVAVMNAFNFTVNKAPVDVSGFTDKGFITLLERAGSKQITFSASGVCDDDTLLTASLGSDSEFFADAKINFLSDDDLGTVVKTITVDLYMSSYTEDFTTAGARTFSASFATSGAWSYAAPTPPPAPEP